MTGEAGEARAGSGSRKTARRCRWSFALASRVLVGIIVVVAVLMVLLLVWYAADLLLLLFAGVLVSIPLRRLQRLLQSGTGLGAGVSYGIVVLVLLAVVAGMIVLSAGLVASQADRFRPGAADGARHRPDGLRCVSRVRGALSAPDHHVVTVRPIGSAGSCSGLV